jgi:hypothetical protein
MKADDDIKKIYDEAAVNTNPKVDKTVFNRIITTAFTKDIISDLTYRYILLFVFGALCVVEDVMFLLIAKRTGSSSITCLVIILSLLSMHGLFLFTYTECRVGSLRNEILKILDKQDLKQNLEQTHNAAKSHIYRTIFIIILAAVTLTVLWFMLQGIMKTPIG